MKMFSMQKSTYYFRHQRNHRIMTYTRTEKDSEGKWFVQISILVTQSLIPGSLSYCRQLGFFMRILVAFLPLSELCLLYAISTSPNKISADWKTVNSWQKLFRMWRTRNVCSLFCSRIMFSFPPEEKYPKPPLSGLT